MHNFDKTQRDMEMEAEHEHEHEHEAEGEAFLGSLFGEAEAEHEHEHEHEHEYEAEHEHEAEHELELEAESPLSEAQEMELASELLEVSSEAELEYFFGNLVRSVGRGLKSFAKSNVGRALGGAVKGLAKKALPALGTLAGGAIGGPIGAKIGGSLGNFASGLFELELEGLNHEDREYEVARQVVRLGAAAVNRAARTSRRVPPVVAARKAFTSAARVYAPGMFRHRGCTTCGVRGRTAFRGRRLRHAGPGFVRRVNGSTRVVGAPTYGVPTYGASPTYVEPAAAAVTPGAAVTSDVADGEPASAVATYGGSPRGGRWFRRGRHIVLTGL